MWQNSKTQFFTKLKKEIATKFKNSNCDKTKITQVVTKLKNQIVTKLKKSNCDKTQKIKLRQNSKNQIVIVVIVTVVTVIVRVTSFSKNNQLDTSTSVWCVQGSFSQPCDVSLVANTVGTYSYYL